MKSYLKLMMISGIVFFSNAIYCNSNFPIEEQGDFDNDNIIDTLQYKCCQANDVSEFPSCKVSIITKSKIYFFTVEYTFEPPSIFGEKGVIYIDEWIYKNNEHYYSVYLYNKEKDNWLKIKDVLLDDNDNLIEDFFSDNKRKVIGIDGKEYN